MTDLHPQPTASPPKPKTSGKRSWKTIEDALRAVASKIEPKPIKTDWWTYQDAHGNPVMVVARFDAADGSKTYRPLHRLSDGSWAMGDPPGLLPLYRLAEVIKSNGPVFVAEGEKCVLALEGIRADATTSAHGAKPAEKSNWTPLAKRPVVILPDHDAPGEGYVAALLRIFKGLNPRPASVKVVRLPDLAEGGDVVDWIPMVVGDRVGDEAHKAVWDALQAAIDAAPMIDLDGIKSAPAEAPRAAADTQENEAPIPIHEWPCPPEDAAFDGLTGEVVRLIEPSSEADPAGVLLQFLIGFGNAVGSGLWVLADGHHHHANEFVVTVGDTSRARKGTAWRRVRPFLTLADPGWAESQISGGLSSGEGLIHAIRDPVFGVDGSGNPVCKDHGVNDKRVLVVESEFGNVLRVLAREGNTLSAILRMAWDSDDLRTMTKNNPTKATNPHVSLLGHITQQELAKYLSHVEVFNGLGNRILWGCVRRSKRLPFGGSLNDGDVQRLGSRLVAAADLARGVGAMIWTSSGRTFWEANYDALTQDRPGLWGAITSRAEAHVLRLAMIYAALDRSREIADTQVLAALAVWQFCDRSAAFLFGGSLGDRDADAILDALRSKPEGMTRTEIRRVVFQDHKTSNDVARTLALLLRFHLIRPEIAQTGGRPAERWLAVKP
jgi:hypothetical protein